MICCFKTAQNGTDSQTTSTMAPCMVYHYAKNSCVKIDTTHSKHVVPFNWSMVNNEERILPLTNRTSHLGPVSSGNLASDVPLKCLPFSVGKV